MGLYQANLTSPYPAIHKEHNSKLSLVEPKPRSDTMRRSILVPALILVLMVVFCGEAFSRSHPYGYNGPKYQSDDHTWGGDFQVGGCDSYEQRDGLIGGFTPVDIFIAHIFLRWLSFNSVDVRSDAETDHFIQHQIETTTPDEPVITNDRGGL